MTYQYEQPRNTTVELNDEFAAALRALRAEGHRVFTKAEIVQNAAHRGAGIARDLDAAHDAALDFLAQIKALRQFS